MTEMELQKLRREKWLLDGQPIRTTEEARAFIESVGFCLLYPQEPPVLVPTLIGACSGSADKLPTWQHAFSDSRAQKAIELMIPLLRNRDVYEVNRLDDNNPLLIAASIFPYFYGLVGERNSKLPPKAGPRSEYSQLASDAFGIILRAGPISNKKMQEALGGSVSIAALNRALGELAARLRICRVDYNTREGSFWDVLFRWAPDAVRAGMHLSLGESLSALLSKYLECVVAADQQELDNFLGNFVARSRVGESVKALLNARELEFTQAGQRSLVQVVPAAPTQTAYGRPRGQWSSS